MGRKYVMTFESAALALATPEDAFQLGHPNLNLRLLMVLLSQTSDVGDANSQGIPITIGTVTAAITGAAAARPLKPGTTAAGGNRSVNNAVQQATGLEIEHSEGWNILTPFLYMPAEGLEIESPRAGGIVVQVPAPTNALIYHGTLIYEEMGG